MATLSGDAADITTRTIIFEFRFPRAITAVLAGSGLAVSGLMMQTLFRNPLAGPFVLGISSGASLGVAILILTTSGAGSFLLGIQGSTFSILLSASIGALLVLFVVLVVSHRTRDTVSLLIIGIMIGSLASALVSAMQYFSNAEEIQRYLLWTFGSLGKVTRADLIFFTPVVIICVLASFFTTKMLNTFLLGDQYAISMGMNLKLTRGVLVMVSGVLAGTITAFCGPIAFIGLSSPHIARMILKNGDHKYLIPGSILSGIVLMLFCDIISQLPGSAIVLPINIVTSLFGAPLVIWLIFQSRGLKNSF